MPIDCRYQLMTEIFQNVFDHALEKEAFVILYGFIFPFHKSKSPRSLKHPFSTDYWFSFNTLHSCERIKSNEMLLYSLFVIYFLPVRNCVFHPSKSVCPSSSSRGKRCTRNSCVMNTDRPKNKSNVICWIITLVFFPLPLARTMRFSLVETQFPMWHVNYMWNWEREQANIVDFNRISRIFVSFTTWIETKSPTRCIYSV